MGPFVPLLSLLTPGEDAAGQWAAACPEEWGPCRQCLGREAANPAMSLAVQPGQRHRRQERENRAVRHSSCSAEAMCSGWSRALYVVIISFRVSFALTGLGAERCCCLSAILSGSPSQCCSSNGAGHTGASRASRTSGQSLGTHLRWAGAGLCHQVDFECSCPGFPLLFLVPCFSFD